MPGALEAESVAGGSRSERDGQRLQIPSARLVCTSAVRDPDPSLTPPLLRYRNATVANLSLMALGSSAPEILLNVIEITTGKFMAGDLGPSTIVGSAAFNLLVILGVCVAAITEGTRRIEEMKARASPSAHLSAHGSAPTLRA